MSNLIKLEKDFEIEQKAICAKYKADFLAAPFDTLIGVATSTFVEFNIKPMHIYHLLELCPKAIKYLGLAPGWRFLFDNTYEDVWYDQSLLAQATSTNFL